MAIGKYGMLNILEKDIKATLLKKKDNWIFNIKLDNKEYTTGELDDEEMKEFLSLVSQLKKPKAGIVSVDSNKITKKVIDAWLIE